MARIFGQTLPLDMLVLWAVETVICFFALYAALNYGHVFPVIATLHVSEDAALRAANITLLLGAVCFVLGLYRPTAILQIRMLFLTVAVATMFALPIFWSVLGRQSIQPILFGSRNVWLLEVMAYWVILLAGTRLLYGAAMRRGLFARTVMVVGYGQAATDIASALRVIQPCAFRITVATPGEMAVSSIRPWQIILAGVTPAEAASLGKQARTTEIHTFCETQFGRVDLASLADPQLATHLQAAIGDSVASRVLRRGLDIVGASVLLVLTAPVMLLTVLAVKLDSPGPAIYRQLRVGLGGREFVILKFRSMRVDAERNGVAVWASVRDSRVTRVGAFIRKVRLDELPQLLNILCGDMSLVGPRPERPSLVVDLNAAIPFFCMRTRVKPGLTGWAQINSAYTASTVEAREKLSYDLYYAKNRTLMLDLMIIVATVRILIFQVGSR